MIQYAVNVFSTPIKHAPRPKCNTPNMFWRFGDGGFAGKVYRCRCGSLISLTTGVAVDDIYWYWADVDSTDGKVLEFKKRWWQA